ncbi:MAG: DUF2802 domain-containing protein [Zoogloeaceae bacterium]|jgi:hypothetical protein|nr:DUF2802 domain-containing protein [Zoogloeaceae bacterium]
MATANLLGWREILLTLILLIVAYMFWLIWRMRRINRFAERARFEAMRVEPQASSSDGTAAGTSDTEVSPGSDDAQTEEREDMPPIYERPRNRPQSAASSETFAAPNVSFAQRAFMAGVEREMAQLREEMDALRGAFSALRSDNEGWRDAVEQEMHKLQMAQNAAPLYNDAMQMALLGHDAVTIAERCGIARAEADLVVALIKRKEKS